MSETVKTMLIIEDHKGWQEKIATLCQRAHKKLYGNEGTTIKVSNVEKALYELKKRPIHLASVDLRLEGDAQNTKDLGGLQFLQEIYSKKLGTVSIVVSGEYDPDLSAVSKKYGVLTFQQKDKPRFPVTFLKAVEAGLLYVEARELLDEGKYKASLAKWKQAKDVARLIEEEVADAKDWTFPVDIEEEYQARFKHPITRLPTSLRIEDKLAELVSRDKWILFYIEIKHLDAFVESQGHIQEEILLKDTNTKLIQEAFANQISKGSFIGQTSDNIFAVILHVTPNLRDDQIKVLIEEIKNRFESEVSLPHYDFWTRQRGEIEYEDKDGNRRTSPLVSLAVGFVRGQRNKFRRGWLNESGDVEYGNPEDGDIRDIDRAARLALRQLS